MKVQISTAIARSPRSLGRRSGMKKRRLGSAPVALMLAAMLLGACSFVAPYHGEQYASLEPADAYPAQSVTDPAVAMRVNHSFQAVAVHRPLRLRVTKRAPVRSLLEMRHHDVVIQSWDLSCGAAALATLLRYEWGDPVTEKQIARGLMGRKEYVRDPQLVQIREGFSLLDLKRYVQEHGFKGEGLGKLEFSDLVENAPIMVPVDALGYNHFVIFRGVLGDRVLLADPAWGNRTMTIDKFQRMWLNYGKSMGHVGFVVERADGRKPLNTLKPRPSDFVMLD
ncbi:MAG: C39 family peptidase [Stellaceae bacterium]